MWQRIKASAKSEKGFTLVELLAVIVILGIVAGIAVPSIGGIINKAENDAKVAEGISIVNAAKLYVTSNNPSAATTTLTKTELDNYLDNVKNDTYTVTVKKDQSSGKYSYELKNHNSVRIVGDKNATATEKELLEY
ncbi:type II secretion system protein [Bacillus sp. V33-4]|uniref:type II secretion system protein n=1 Tax=Bacillus sp. V33-4 TaxID=2054169 RepID=UPI000C760A79|nr:type II secretion system protein [Bacillus sp. V33-4]PLR86261.1 prepilin-type cleavage/methylation domain-containing protein [Bacillus sp. V33-4]